MDFEKYENNVEYPKPVKRICKGCNKSFDLDDRFCSSCGHTVGLDYKADFIKRKEGMMAYNAESSRLYNLFKEDALRDAGLLDYKKADDVFNFAWNHGHSSGFYEVYNYLMELSELF